MRINENLLFGSGLEARKLPNWNKDNKLAEKPVWGGGMAGDYTIVFKCVCYG